MTMRSNPMRRCLLLAAVSWATVASCSSEASARPDQIAVCDALQSVVDQMQAGRSRDALAGMDALAQRVAESDDADLQAAGDQFLGVLLEPVDYESMTVEQSNAMGDQVLAESGAGLEAMGQHCADLGLPVEVDVAALER